MKSENKNVTAETIAETKSDIIIQHLLITLIDKVHQGVGDNNLNQVIGAKLL